MKHTIIISCIMVTMLGISGCKKFLDVQPKTSLSEKELFTSEAGFQQALNGSYSQLATRALYGDNLSMGFASALSQDYGPTNGDFYDIRRLDYTSTAVLSRTGQIWSAAYTAIAGLNKIITSTEINKSLLTPNKYALFRGEALGLRAMLHFDLLRIFGPEYVAGQNLKAIPFKTTVTDVAQPPSTTKEVTELVLADLTSAAQLLKDNDPIVTAIGDRRMRMNYYAVKGLEARVRLYAGDKPGANAAALVVASSGKFPFVTSAAALASPASRDRLYMTEQVFTIRVRDIATWVDGATGYFKYQGTTSNKLTRTETDFNNIYESSATDMRLLYRIESDQGFKFPSKYWQTWVLSGADITPNRMDQNVPAIRLSEMYYILAETSATVAEGIGHLNTVRRARNLANLATTLTPELFETEILKEYRKEFHAEGQLFYYYKRKNIRRMQFQTADILLSKYVLPIPLTELEFNPTYN